MTDHPKRVVCLTEETTETLYSIGASELIAGITEYTVRPERAIEEKPVVSRYIHADYDEILKLKPDIVLTWSDMQAKITAELVSRGIEVYNFNHFDLQGILNFVVKLGALVNKREEADNFSGKLKQKLDQIAERGSKRQSKPKVYFEEWYNPLIAGSKWVSEIIELAGGVDVCKEEALNYKAKDRIIEDHSAILDKDPDIMLVSWCGKPYKQEKILKRALWDQSELIKNNKIFEIDSSIILQPGPAAILDGTEIIADIFDKWEKSK